MKLRTSLHRILNSLVAKPAPRRGWRAGVVLEALEIRINLSAVLIVETVDAYWIYDDADALLKAAAEGQAADCNPSNADSDFTSQELQVIDGIVAELIASEGYTDRDILSITYIDDTTSDELIAEGYFYDGFFDEVVVTETLPDSAVSAGQAETADVLIDVSNTLSNLTGAAGTDTISLGDGDLLIEANAQSRDQLTALVANAVLPVIEATLDAPPVDQASSPIRAAETHSGLKNRLPKLENYEDVAKGRKVFQPSLAMKAEAIAISAVTQLANASELLLPFAKFPSAGLAGVGFVSGLEYATTFWSPQSASNTDDSTNLESDDHFPFSFSQIAAAFGASGLAVAYWLNSQREFESASSVKQPRRRVRGIRLTSR